MNKFDSFHSVFESSIEKIKAYQVKLEMAKFTNWLLETDINPYTIFHENIANKLSTAEGFSSVLDQVNHALFDDGDICFPVIKHYTMISFSDKFDFKLDHVFSDLFIESFKRHDTNVTFLSSIDEFMERANENHIKSIKRAFKHDVNRLGLEYTVQHYSSYKDFNESWITEVIK